MFQNVLIATFALYVQGKRSSINGMIEPLLSFFLPKVKKITLIEGTHPGSDSIKVSYEIYENKKIKKSSFSYLNLFLFPFLKIQNSNQTQIIFKIRDFLSVLELPFHLKERYDLFIGLESIYTLAGIVLKKIGLVKTVVYYVSDYSPNRYSNKLLNRIYLLLDRLCCYYSNYIWDVSPAMQPARIKNGLDLKRCGKVILVPNALFAEQISYLPTQKIQPFTLVFAGTFGVENGLGIAIAAMKKVIRNFPRTELHIIGGGYTSLNLKKIAKENQVLRNITFHGFIHDVKILSKTIQKFAIGLAPYLSTSDSARWYADATKIRLYLGCGLPVITTYVPPLGKEIKEKGAAIIVNDKKEDLANAIIKIFSNKNRYQKMRKAAINFAKKNLWENSYRNALLKMNNNS